MQDNETENQIAFDFEAPSPKEPVLTPDVEGVKYDVGYARPPQHSRFKPGQSGNPKGKPKGAKNLTTIVGNAIKEKIALTENGKRKMVSKLEVAIKQLVNKAATGDAKALAQLLPLIQIIEGRAESAAATTTAPMDEADKLTMDGIIERLQRSADTQTTPITPEPQDKEPKS